MRKFTLRRPGEDDRSSQKHDEIRSLIRPKEKGQRESLPSRFARTILRFGDFGEVHALDGHAADLMAPVSPGDIGSPGRAGISCV
jgi:hypothetical protein